MKRFMKQKWTAFVLLFMLCASGALAEPVGTTDTIPSDRWAKGVAQAVDTVDVFAPLGGQLLAFDVMVGDVVDAETILFNVRPQQVLASNSGVIRSLHAVVGDQAAGTVTQYGALCYIDRVDIQWVRATVNTAYDKPENRALTLGETLRVYNGKTSDPISTLGTVISVDGKSYVVEIPAGVFDLEDKVRLYRAEGDSYSSKDRVGEGKVERVKPIAVTTQGVIAGVHVTEGQHVTQGDALFTLDDATSVHKETAKMEVHASRGGVVSAIYVQDGQQVMKDQLLLTLKPLDVLEFVVDVDELDIPSISVGQTMNVKVDALGDSTITATVKRVSPLGIKVLDTTKYPVTLSIQDTPEALLPGMHMTAYWD